MCRAGLQHSDTLASLTSEASHSSMDSVLQSREADPEQVLLNLGFAGSEALARIPLRFLIQPSHARGVSIETFKKQQDEMIGRFESSFFGYRGLQGSLHRRPSELVEKILKTLKERELKEIQKTATTFSINNQSIPARFKIMDPTRITFDSLVSQVAKAAEKEKDNKNKPNLFKSLAKSVLSPENREWRQEQIELNNSRVQQLLVLGGKSFLLDEEGECEAVAGLRRQDSVQTAEDSEQSEWSECGEQQVIFSTGLQGPLGVDMAFPSQCNQGEKLVS